MSAMREPRVEEVSKHLHFHSILNSEVEGLLIFGFLSNSELKPEIIKYV